MRYFLTKSLVLVAVIYGGIALPDAQSADATVADPFGKRASWNIPTTSEVRKQLDDWLAAQEVDDATREKIDAIWGEGEASASPTRVLETVTRAFAEVDSEAARIVALCQDPQMQLVPPEFAYLDNSSQNPADDAEPSLETNDASRTDDWVRNNLRLLYARWLAQNALYDEVLEQLDGVKPVDVVDPASLLFYRAVAQHRLLKKDECLETLATISEQKESLPRRYASLVQLMEADIRPLETDSLDEVARMMDDIRRRLELGRAGTQVRKQEDEVIAKLDKMIEEIEQQQQQAAAAAAAGGSSSAPSNPLQDSIPVQQKGPGNVDPKQLGDKSGWGNLPPKERQEALQQISKDLPAHYREVIEEYFRKLAREGS